MKWLGDAGSLILALVLGVMVWLAATQSAEPMRELELGSTAEEEIEVALEGVSPDRAAYDVSPRRATVRMRGVPSDLDALEPADVRVWADLSGALADGTVFSAPLRAECIGCGRDAVRIAAVEPSLVNVRVGPSRERRVPVRLGSEEEGQESCGGVAANFDPAMVTVRGAASRVAAVEYAALDMPGAVAPETRTELASVPVIPVTAAGEPVADMEVSPSRVRATIEFVQLPTCAQVAVLPVYNDPPAGYYVAGIEVNPDHIQLRGDPARLDAYRAEAVILTELIDISDSRASVEALAQLDLPADVEPVGAAEGVTVTILVSPFPSTRLLEIPLQEVGLGDGLAVDGLSPSRVQVLVSGPLPELDGLDVASLRGTVDLNGLAAGTHRLRPAIELPPGLRVRSVAPTEVDVRLVSGTPPG